MYKSPRFLLLLGLAVLVGYYVGSHDEGVTGATVLRLEAEIAKAREQLARDSARLKVAEEKVADRDRKLSALENDLIRARAEVEAKGGTATAADRQRIKDLEQQVKVAEESFAREEKKYRDMEEKVAKDRDTERKALDDKMETLERKLSICETAVNKLGGCLNSQDCRNGEVCVDHKCQVSPVTITMTANEGTKLKLSCPTGSGIKVRDAAYGNPEVGCKAASSKLVASVLCDRKTTCDLPATNTMFGSDPCPNTDKQLEVTYNCVQTTRALRRRT